MKLDATIETLKEILDNVQTPERLEQHAWLDSLFVKDAVLRNSHLNDKTSGERILFAVSQQFRMLMPVSPPKHGIRLDPRWTEFGFLAAKYFTPILFGRPVPESLQDACARMDESILLFIYNKPAADLSKEQIELYKLIGDEFISTPLSTLSDWHRKGLQRLADAINMRETHLSISTPLPSPTEPVPDSRTESTPEQAAPKNKKRKWIRISALVALFFLLIFGCFKAWKVYEASILVYNDVIEIQNTIDFPPSIQQVEEAGPSLKKLQKDMKSLRAEVDGYLWVAPMLGWIPRYGCEIEAAPHLLQMTDSLIDAGVGTYDASQPFLDIMNGGGSKAVTPDDIVSLLIKQNKKFAGAYEDVDDARAARAEINGECLSPYVKNDLLPKGDLLLNTMEDVLTLAANLPNVVGAGSDGPKTYLVLIQNEDELRPTGGFITAAGNLLLRNGEIASFDIENSEQLDDWSKPYPSAPWQLREYMNSPVMVFRDANWFTNYPDSALYAEYLYSYTHEHSVDGVLTVDQYSLVQILRAIGPVNILVDDESVAVNADNVLEFIRAEHLKDSENKKTLGKIASAMIEKITNDDADWRGLVDTAIRLLNEKHVLVQLDDPDFENFVDKRNWHGVVGPLADGDFLMVVDSNIGFNKTSMNVTTSMSYEVDLSNLEEPVSNLSVSHQNASDDFVPCIQFGLKFENYRVYPANRCYWDYLRVYAPEGTRLLFADPQNIPADWMIRRQPVTAKTDLLDEEIDGVQTFGLLKVIPGGRMIVTNFRFSLPSNVISSVPDSDEMVYRLKIQKQPGTVAIPIAITLKFPKGVAFTSTPSESVTKGNTITIQTDLRIDRIFEVIYRSP